MIRRYLFTFLAAMQIRESTSISTESASAMLSTAANKECTMNSDPADSERPYSKVSFNVVSEELDVDSVTLALGLQPDKVVHRGEYPYGDPTYTARSRNVWTLESKLTETEPLEVHVIALLDVLRTKAEAIREMAQKADVNLRCALFYQPGVRIPAVLLRRIAELDINLDIVVY